jgi:hypothetical protein
MVPKSSEVLVGRRFLERGFLDSAMKLFVRNAAVVDPADWTRLGERLMERSRIPDVVRICEIGGVPLPRERMLGIADEHLRRKDVDTAIRLFELAGADRERWGRLVDVLTGLPDRERLAIEVTQRHLDHDPTRDTSRVGADPSLERSVVRATGLPRPAKPARHARYAQ